jgi:C4-type Zn-finger protein
MQDLNGYSDSDDDFTQKIKNIIATLDQFMSGDKKFTLILDDPLSNSFLRNPYHPE